jgi:hypothetical protein
MVRQQFKTLTVVTDLNMGLKWNQKRMALGACMLRLLSLWVGVLLERSWQHQVSSQQHCMRQCATGDEGLTGL